MTIELKDTDAISVAVHRRLFDTHRRQKKKKGEGKDGRGCVDVVIKTGVVSGVVVVDSSKAMQPIATGVVGRFVALERGKRNESGWYWRYRAWRTHYLPSPGCDLILLRIWCQDKGTKLETARANPTNPILRLTGIPANIRDTGRL